MTANRNYQFRWELLGNIDEGRPHLGKFTRLEIYRLMQFTFRDVLEERFGLEAADELFYAAGLLAGKEFYAHYLSPLVSTGDFWHVLQDALRDLGVGILRLESQNHPDGQMVLSIAEDLDCSGLPEMDTEICVYDEGFLAGVLECQTGRHYQVKEVDCWCSGDRICRFQASVIE